MPRDYQEQSFLVGRYHANMLDNICIKVVMDKIGGTEKGRFLQMAQKAIK